MLMPRFLVRIVVSITTATPIIILAGAAYSQQATNAGAAGAGGTSCAVFGDGYKKWSNEIEGTYFQWAQGMMSGMNFIIYARKQTTTNLNTWGMERQMQFIRLFCANNPLVPYNFSVISLFDTIRQEQGLPDWRR
jgi:hypothetical protein